MDHPDIRRDPDELRAAALAVDRVLDELRPLLAGHPGVPEFGPDAGPGGFRRVSAELQRLGDQLRDAADAAERADGDAAGAVRWAAS